MQKISSLTLVLTEACNFSCAYCPQRRGKNTLTIDAITAFLDFLRPRLAKEVWLGFSGGEPLLAWPLIEKTVVHAQKIPTSIFHFTLTTNGALMKKEHVAFFKENGFELVLSYDGLAQAQRDQKSVVAVEKALSELKDMYPEGYTVNSVFTPQTVPLLASSMERTMNQGHPNLRYALDLGIPWEKPDLEELEKQLDRLATNRMKHRRETGTMPMENFGEEIKRGVFACFAGRDRLALLPDNTVWGCYLFNDLLGPIPEHPDYSKYCFGKLPDVVRAGKTSRTIAARYRDLRQDYFFTDRKDLCSLCPELENCTVCPVVAALASGQLGVIPVWVCRVKTLQARFKARLTAAH